MSFLNSTLSVFRRITVVIAIAIAFLFGLATTVYLSLRSPEVTVPDVMGKDRFEAENILGHAGLNFRVRATRPSNQVKSDTVLFQLPRAGEVVKVGQTVAMDISRATKEGESSVSPPPKEEEKRPDVANTASNDNRPARNRNTNKNGNENGNANANRTANANANSNANANRVKANANANLDSNVNTNTTRATDAANANKVDEDKSSTNSNSPNENRRPAPKPSPTERNNNRDNR